jgi:5-methylcytosine-specific restriction protein B
MSLGEKDRQSDVYDQAIANNYIALGWGGNEDWSSDKFKSLEAIKIRWESEPRDDPKSSNWEQTHQFRNEMKKGDIVIISYGNTKFRAIAQIEGNYEFDPSCQGHYPHRRKVRWLRILDEPHTIDTIIKEKNFSQLTLYPLPKNRIEATEFKRLLAGNDRSNEKNTAEESPQQFVLIIDEINRANISKVFGELITLLEPDKRLGMTNAPTLTLPYSGDKFGVPPNLHIIGTMNTADRSIALLDTALRRRFTFKEMAPNPELLKTIDGINLKAFLKTLNDRIEYLIDREHRIGHAFFMSCEDRNAVDDVMRYKIIPLLQEYFFEDWSRIYAVLGNGKSSGFISSRKIKAPPDIDGPDLDSWFILDVFKDDAYDRLVSVQTSRADNTSYSNEDQNLYESSSE